MFTQDGPLKRIRVKLKCLANRNKRAAHLRLGNPNKMAAHSRLAMNKCHLGWPLVMLERIFSRAQKVGANEKSTVQKLPIYTFVLAEREKEREV